MKEIATVLGLLACLAGRAAAQSCVADVDGNHAVDAVDLLALLAAWGPCPGACPPECPGDLTASCTVDVADLLALLNGWGPCLPPANDECDARIEALLDPTAPMSLPLDLRSATPSPEPSSCLGAPHAHGDVWYGLTNDTPAARLVTVTTTVDLVVEITGAACAAATPIACGLGPAGGAAFELAAAEAVTIRLIDDLGLSVHELTGVMHIASTEVPPCDNDGCVDRLVVGAGAHAFDTTGCAPGAEDPPVACAAGAGPEVWFGYVAAASGTLALDTFGSGFDTVLDVFGGADCPPAAGELDCNDDAGVSFQSAATLTVDEGDELVIRVGGWNGDAGAGVLHVTLTAD